ncbi:hypothetical protein BMF94_0759 [Rhodotorula taiwanensis]|uniref:CTLH domain-containing protein n=1 Tax=Rhodotorula taiwanensis TaxID=741276 RepID=A0A2S5BGY0_9BASI|nr:hypothetical protein BMF94_0759 [Rhodotorula taiwanensis]
MASKRPVTSPEDWSKRLAEVNVSKDDLNFLVANYLFTEGYLSAAEHFTREAGLDAITSSTNSSSKAPSFDVESIKTRMEVRRAVLKGEVETALDKVVDLDLEILDLDPSLHFHLLQQHLIELIRAQHIPEALAFAQNELAPLAEEHPRFLKELEKTMALLAFELPTLSVLPSVGDGAAASTTTAPAAAAAAPTTMMLPSVAQSASVKEKKSKKGASSAAAADPALPPMPTAILSLLDPSQRLRTAWELNAAILNAQGHASEPKLPGLMSIMNWGEGLLNEKGVDWPRWNLHDLLSEKAVESAAAADAMVL